jgi:hypothetical protein
MGRPQEVYSRPSGKEVFICYITKRFILVFTKYPILSQMNPSPHLTYSFKAHCSVIVPFKSVRIFTLEVEVNVYTLHQILTGP